jgi:TBC1 domain family member 8/9
VPRKDSFLKRDLDARAHSEAYRLKFHLPINEKLDGSSDGTLWTPYNKHHVWGTLYLSQNFVCFDSRVNNSNGLGRDLLISTLPIQVLSLVTLVIPLSIVTLVEKVEAKNTAADLSILISTKCSSSFLFSNLKDRDFVIKKIMELVGKMKMNLSTSVSSESNKDHENTNQGNI